MTNNKNHQTVLLVLLIISAHILPQPTDTPILAVNDLIPQGIAQSEAVIVSEQLRAELLKSGKVKIVERNQMQEILKEQGFQQTGCTTDACAVEMGQLLGVNTMLVGTLGVGGSYTVLTVKIIDVKTGAIVSSETMQTRGGIDKVIEEGIGDISAKVTAKLTGEQVEQPAQEPVKKKKPETRKVILAGSLGVCVLGATAAILVVSNKNLSDDLLPLNNVEIILP